MGPINNKGRPVYGVQPKTVERKIRLEPYLDEQLTIICRSVGISRAEGIRQGIMMFINYQRRRNQEE